MRCDSRMHRVEARVRESQSRYRIQSIIGYDNADLSTFLSTPTCRHKDMPDALPVIDLLAPRHDVARAVHAACRAHGFFYIVGHGIDESLGKRLEDLSHRFFALPQEVKERYAMPLAGRAWRGWCPLGGELTSGRADWKEGLYVGNDLPATHARVRAGVPLHGQNLLPGDDVLPGFAHTIHAWMSAVTALGPRVVE